MRTGIVVLVLLAALAGGAVAGEVDREKLRKAVKLPAISLQGGILVNKHQGYLLMGEKPSVPAEVTAVQSTIKGDASDAERYYRLGELHAQVDEGKKAKEAFSRAADLFRQQVKTQPDNGRLLTQLGLALLDAGKDQEAEVVLQQAVRVAPREWRCWAALGRFLDRASTRALMDEEQASEKLDALADVVELVRSIQDRPPSAERIVQARKLMEQARACYDKAVAAAPHEPQPYAERARGRCSLGIGDAFIYALQGVDCDPFAELFRPEYLPDLEQAAKLSPNDPQAICVAVWFEVMSLVTHRRVTEHASETWNKLPEKTKQSINAAVVRLEKLSQSRDARVATCALEELGVLQIMVLHDLKRAETTLRRAVALNPLRERSWDLLAGALEAAECYEDFVIVCTERLKHKDSAHNRYQLARAYEEVNQLDKAEEQLIAALKSEPDHILANLGLAIVLLKRREDASTLASADERIDKARQLLVKADSHSNDVEYVLARSLFLVLKGERNEAEVLLRQMLKQNEDSKTIRKALEAFAN